LLLTLTFAFEAVKNSVTLDKISKLPLSDTHGVHTSYFKVDYLEGKSTKILSRLKEKLLLEESGEF